MSTYLSVLLSLWIGLQPTPLYLIGQNVSDSLSLVETDETTPEVIEVRAVWVTAYSSTPDQTDDTPFITASNTRVRQGIVATNLYPFGTRIQIPEAFGDEIFVVEDRMARRKTNNVDIWMEYRQDALNFGAMKTHILVLND